jgi:hypothetical protein
MSHKLLPRLGSAIASTILSYAALSVAGVDQVQAAVLTYNFRVTEGGGSGFFKLSDSSLTKTGREALAVSEGEFYTRLTASRGKDYYDLAGTIAYFFNGNLSGLRATGRDVEIRGVPGSDYTQDSYAFWSINVSYFWGYRETIISYRGANQFVTDRIIINDTPVTYTLVNTEPEPVGERVPEPLTAGGTALALAGLSWLKHKKKMAA